MQISTCKTRENFISNTEPDVLWKSEILFIHVNKYSPLHREEAFIKIS